MFDSFELNKVAGAVLFSLLVMMGIGLFSEAVFHVEAPEKPGYVVEVAEHESGGGGEAAEAVPLPQLLANADAGRGEAAAKKCLACHTFEDGGPNKVGPNLHNVVGRDIASHEGFAYSDAMKAQEGPWTYEHLNQFLTNPKKAVPGTAMAFAGVRKDDQRADILVFLKSLNPDAPPLPEPVAAPAGEGGAGDGKAADGETAEDKKSADGGEQPAQDGGAKQEQQAPADKAGQDQGDSGQQGGSGGGQPAKAQ